MRPSTSREATRHRSLGGYAACGTAYGLASLGCTLPVFLAVVGTSLQLHGLAAAIGQFLRGLSVRTLRPPLADALGDHAAISKSTVSAVCGQIKDE